MGDSVLGHYSCVLGSPLQPLLAESSALFRAVVEDDLQAVCAWPSLEAESARMHNVLHWTSMPEEPQQQRTASGRSSSAGADAAPEGGPSGSRSGNKPVVTVKQRTLLALAAYHGSVKVLKLLLGAKGVDARLRMPDGQTAGTVRAALWGCRALGFCGAKSARRAQGSVAAQRGAPVRRPAPGCGPAGPQIVAGGPPAGAHGWRPSLGAAAPRTTIETSAPRVSAATRANHRSTRKLLSFSSPKGIRNLTPARRGDRLTLAPFPPQLKRPHPATCALSLAQMAQAGCSDNEEEVLALLSAAEAAAAAAAAPQITHASTTSSSGVLQATGAGPPSSLAKAGSAGSGAGSLFPLSSPTGPGGGGAHGANGGDNSGAQHASVAGDQGAAHGGGAGGGNTYGDGTPMGAGSQASEQGAYPISVDLQHHLSLQHQVRTRLRCPSCAAPPPLPPSPKLATFRSARCFVARPLAGTRERVQRVAVLDSCVLSFFIWRSHLWQADGSVAGRAAVCATVCLPRCLLGRRRWATWTGSSTRRRGCPTRRRSSRCQSTRPTTSGCLPSR